VSELRVTHLGLCVRSLDVSVPFYEQALGFTEVRRLRVDNEETATLLGVAAGGLDLVYLERDGLRIELLEYERGATAGERPRPMDETGFTHLSVLVDDAALVAAEIVAKGGGLVDGSAVTFEWGNRGLMALDPDGTRLELIERRPA
jgi:catechol 2,3-dioxygenase-like lactoylglutathione lyase family enzyme